MSSPAFSWWRIPIMFSASVFTSLPAGDSLITNSKSESELLYDWLFTARQFVSAPSPSRFTDRNLFLQLNPRSHSPYETSSLTRGWVCHLRTGFALLARTAQKMSFLCFCFLLLPCKHACLRSRYPVTAIVAYLAVVAQQRVYLPQYRDVK
jgi:hypothetical protein